MDEAAPEHQPRPKHRPRLGIMVAVAENGVIGRDGDLPWSLPGDLRNFKRLTVGHVLVMGRKTWESIGRPLPERRSIVLSRQADFRAEGAEVVADLDSALQLARDAEQVFVIGGSSVFAEALEKADDLHFTRVHAEIEGDVCFPELDWSRWQEVESSHHPADERHAHAFTAHHYVRRDPQGNDADDNGGIDMSEDAVLRCGEVGMGAVRALVERFGLELEVVPPGAEIPGSYWGAPEAGLVGRRVVVRDDTPIHSCLHETGHLVCMDEARRARLHTEAGGEDVEENGVCYLQVLLADHLPGVGRQRLVLDMDRWGYSFRLGSTRAWFEEDADDARAWLVANGLVDADGRVLFRLRS